MSRARDRSPGSGRACALARGSRIRLVVAAALGLAAVAPPAPAQDFATAARPGPAATASGFLEDALPPVAAATLLDFSFTSWFGLPSLQTRAASLAFGRGPARVAAGISQTGEPGIGWSTAALALGVARREGGAALRVAARRDRMVEPGSEAALRLDARAGVEAGWGAWLEAARGVTLWAGAPQSWTRGTAPPLERPLALGVELDRDDLALWLTRTAPAIGASAGHSAGAGLRSGPLAAWAEVRDLPLRGGFGLAARARRLSVAAAVDSHPDLGETVRLSVGLVADER
jgi:hypothetical protein